MKPQEELEGDAGASVSVVLIRRICVNPCWRLTGKAGSWDEIPGGVVRSCCSEFKERNYW